MKSEGVPPPTVVQAKSAGRAEALKIHFAQGWAQSAF